MEKDAKGGVIRRGEHFDGFCAGFLQGALAAMQQANIVCPKSDDTDANFLLSVLETYAVNGGAKPGHVAEQESAA